MLTCHNLAYHGWVPRSDVADQLDLPPEVGAPDGRRPAARGHPRRRPGQHRLADLRPRIADARDTAPESTTRCARWATDTSASSTASTPSCGTRPRTPTSPARYSAADRPARRPAARRCAPSSGSIRMGRCWRWSAGSIRRRASTCCAAAAPSCSTSGARICVLGTGDRGWWPSCRHLPHRPRDWPAGGRRPLRPRSRAADVRRRRHRS